MKSIYDFSVKTINGKVLGLSDFKGLAMLIVNVASKCGLTPQYQGLEELYQTFHEKGLVVLGFPANEFLAQEPGSNQEIMSFCTANFGVKFPMFEKIVVKGPGQHPLYQFLTDTCPETIMRPQGTLLEKLESKGLLTGEKNDIKWNFEKFLIDRNGGIVGRFSSELDPMDSIIVSAIKDVLKES